MPNQHTAHAVCMAGAAVVIRYKGVTVMAPNPGNSQSREYRIPKGI
jgi:hypothetical protein